jgi:hypothetical protein
MEIGSVVYVRGSEGVLIGLDPARARALVAFPGDRQEWVDQGEIGGGAEARDCVGIHTHTPVNVPEVVKTAGADEPGDPTAAQHGYVVRYTLHGSPRSMSFRTIASAKEFVEQLRASGIEAEMIESKTAFFAEEMARDYIAVDTRGHTVWGPGKDYSEAKRHAEQSGGVVKWVSGAQESSQSGTGYELNRAAQREFSGEANASLRKLIREKYEEWQRDWSKEEPDAARFLVTVINDRIHGIDQEKLKRVVQVCLGDSHGCAEDVFGRSVRWTFDGHVYQGTGRKGDYLIVPIGKINTGPTFIVYTVKVDSYGGIHKSEIGAWPNHVKAMEHADKYDLDEIEVESMPSTRRERTPVPPPAVVEARETVPVIYEDGAQQMSKPWPAPEIMQPAEAREDRGYRAAGALRPGDRLKDQDGSLVRVVEVVGAAHGRVSIIIDDASGHRRKWNAAPDDPMQLAEIHAAETPVATAPMQGDCLPWVRVTRDPERYESCLAKARKIGPIENSRKVYDLLSPALSKEDQEVLCVVLLDVRRQLRGVSEIHRGQRSRVSVGVTDVMRVVIASGAEAFVCVHQHPSGNSRPSDADVSLTRSIDQACSPFGKDLTFLGHVVVGVGEFTEIAPGGKVSKPYRVK